jgi:mannose-6-phosphate isomerase
VLESLLGRSIPPGVPIGESWEIVDRPEAQSVVAGGSRAGLTLRSVLERECADVMGPEWQPSSPFPILVKWLDCHKRLSLQVHPPADVAKQLHGESKTENWYVAHTEQGTQLIVGLKRDTTRAQFERAIAENNLEACVHHFNVAVGDSILVPSGQVHAIDAGNLILEIQQNSDTTYRVYDWGRVGLDDKPRKLHIAESLKSILWDNFEPAPVRAAPTSGVIAECEAFLIRRVLLDPGEELRVPAGEQPRLLSIVSGSVTASGPRRAGAKGDSGERALGRGTNALLPYSGEFSFIADVPAILLVTEDFGSRGAAHA